MSPLSVPNPEDPSPVSKSQPIAEPEGDQQSRRAPVDQRDGASGAPSAAGLHDPPRGPRGRASRRSSCRPRRIPAPTCPLRRARDRVSPPAARATRPPPRPPRPTPPPSARRRGRGSRRRGRRTAVAAAVAAPEAVSAPGEPRDRACRAAPRRPASCAAASRCRDAGSGRGRPPAQLVPQRGQAGHGRRRHGLRRCDARLHLRARERLLRRHRRADGRQEGRREPDLRRRRRRRRRRLPRRLLGHRDEGRARQRVRLDQLQHLLERRRRHRPVALRRPACRSAAASARVTSRTAASARRSTTGLDFVPGAGSPIQAIADGTVSAVTGPGGAFGNHVEIEHVINGQKVTSTYSHMQTGSVQVSVGETVTVGAAHRQGRLAPATAPVPHLHFEIHLGGVPVDPYPWLQANTN